MIYEDIVSANFRGTMNGEGYLLCNLQQDLRGRENRLASYLNAISESKKTRKIISIDGRIDKYLGDITLSDGFVGIRGESFSKNDTVTSFDASQCHTLKNIGHRVFVDDINLKKVVLNEGLETIDAQAFAWCLSLGNISLPFSLERLNENAFENSGVRVLVCGEKQYPMVEKLKKVKWLSVVFVVDEDYNVKKAYTLQSQANDKQDIFTVNNIIKTVEELIEKNPANKTNEEVIKIINRVPAKYSAALFQDKSSARKKKDADAIL